MRMFPLKSAHIRVPRPLQHLPHQELKNAVVGLLNNQGLLLGIGILIDYEREFLRVYSKPFDDVSDIEIGFVRLSRDGTELGYVI